MVVALFFFGSRSVHASVIFWDTFTASNRAGKEGRVEAPKVAEPTIHDLGSQIANAAFDATRVQSAIRPSEFVHSLWNDRSSSITTRPHCLDIGLATFAVHDSMKFSPNQLLSTWLVVELESSNVLQTVALAESSFSGVLWPDTRDVAKATAGTAPSDRRPIRQGRRRMAFSTSDGFQLNEVIVPEPSSLVLVLLGIVCIATVTHAQGSTRRDSLPSIQCEV